jgi:tetratricopeptide (TPR) repeat protein
VPSQENNRRSAARRRLWASRAALAVALPLAVLVCLEGGLRLAGYGRPTAFLIPDEKPGYFRTNADFARLFLPGNFDLRPLNFRISRHKAPNTVRIVVLGESAAKGVPSPGFAFAPQLREQLRHRYPGKAFEVIDTGVVGLNSHAVYQAARDLAAFEPDLFVIYMGNNEVVGPYGPGCFYLPQMPPLWVIRASIYVRSTRTGQLLGNLISRLSASGHPAGKWGGMAMFVNNAVSGDDPRLGAVYANFAANLRDILTVATGAGAQCVVCTVVANLKDCPPFLSRHGAALSAADLSACTAAFERGRLAWMLGDAAGAREELTAALRIDPAYADTPFILGSLDLQSGEGASARAHFEEALNGDALRFRPTARINQIIRDVAGAGLGGVSLLDVAVALGSDPASPGAPSGREILFEHVHFDWPGNFLLARMMARSCAAATQGQDPGDGGWMDSGACSDALGYTPFARLSMLQQTDALMRAPPFTNQLTHLEDEARLAAEITAAARAHVDPAELARDAQVAATALSREPQDPDLTLQLGDIKIALGDLSGALALARRAQELLPKDPGSQAGEASILIGLGRYDEAEPLLTRMSAAGADVDLLAPDYAAFWAGTARWDEGRRFFDREVARNPRDGALRIVQAGFLRGSGDLAGAERGLRALLSEDPSNEEALEALVDLLDKGGRHDEAARISASTADAQPKNHENSLRAARYLKATGDLDGSVRNLIAAERNGPVNSTIELEIAFALFQLKRPDGLMLHLAEARRLSLFEGNAQVTGSVDRLIGRIQAELQKLPR